jgi:RNA polymerase sigma-70 factor, ECF subfamily
MSGCTIGDITLLLRAWGEGDRTAFDALIPLVYERLQRTAKRYMAGQAPGHLLQSTALVNEAYLHLAKLGAVDWKDRGHFLAVCAQIMRHILVDYARSGRYMKRGGYLQRVTLDERVLPGCSPGRELIALDDALQSLSQQDWRKGQVVELKIFGGMSMEDTALALKVSIGTVKRDWRLARSWLLRELDREKGNGDQPLAGC